MRRTISEPRLPGRAFACRWRDVVGDRMPSRRPRSRESELIAVLKSSASEKDKADACLELARIGTKDSVAPLAALLGDEKLAHMARYALEPIPDPAVDDALRDALGKLKGRLLVGVIGSIGVRRDAKAVEPLSKLLKDKDAGRGAGRRAGPGQHRHRRRRQGAGRRPGRALRPPINRRSTKVCSGAPRPCRPAASRRRHSPSTIG